MEEATAAETPEPVDEQSAADETAEHLGDPAAEEGRTPNVVDVGRVANQFPLPSSSNELPDWVVIPENLQIPRGVQVGFLRFKAAWTLIPGDGDMHCVVWPLTDLDERVAYARLRDNLNAASSELAKQMLRCVNGVRVDWGAKRGTPGCPEDFYRDIGPKCRQMLTRFWSHTHNMDASEVSHFFEHCVAVRTMT